MGMDKKVQQKRLRFVLLRGLGEAFVTSDYDAARLDAVLAGEA
jgi:3-dehydroquinate synthase